MVVDLDGDGGVDVGVSRDHIAIASPREMFRATDFRRADQLICSLCEVHAAVAVRSDEFPGKL